MHASWPQLNDQHALVLNRATAGIRMANPFSAIASAYRIKTASRWWYANCAWDPLGVCAALHADGRVETSCPGCGETISLRVEDASHDAILALGNIARRVMQAVAQTLLALAPTPGSGSRERRARTFTRLVPRCRGSQGQDPLGRRQDGT